METFAFSAAKAAQWSRSEEHTSELQSQSNLVCRLLLEKKKNPAAQPRPTLSHPPVDAPRGGRRPRSPALGVGANDGRRRVLRAPWRAHLPLTCPRANRL